MARRHSYCLLGSAPSLSFTPLFLSLSLYRCPIPLLFLGSNGRVTPHVARSSCSPAAPEAAFSSAPPSPQKKRASYYDQRELNRVALIIPDKHISLYRQLSPTYTFPLFFSEVASLELFLFDVALPNRALAFGDYVTPCIGVRTSLGA